MESLDTASSSDISDIIKEPLKIDGMQGDEKVRSEPYEAVRKARTDEVDAAVRDFQRFLNYNPSALEGRIGSGESPEDFIRRLKPSQRVPCPWGSFHGKSDEFTPCATHESKHGAIFFKIQLQKSARADFLASNLSSCKSARADINNIFLDAAMVSKNVPGHRSMSTISSRSSPVKNSSKKI